MNSRMLAKGSFLPLKSARRSATVTICAPLASSASRMLSGEENFPVPTRSRERNSWPAIVNGRFTKGIANEHRGSSVECREARIIHLLSGSGPGHFPESDEVAVTDEPDTELIQFCRGQLRLDLTRREGGQEAVVEVALQYRRLGSGIFPDQSPGP